MLNFFTKLLTPLFIVLGVVSSPVDIPIEVQPSAQQEIIELRQKIQDLEFEKEKVKIVVEPIQDKEVIKETKKVSKPLVVERVKVPVETAVIEEPVIPVVDAVYQEKLIRFYDKVKSLNEGYYERIYESREQININKLNQELKDLSQKYDDIVRAQNVGLVYGLEVIDNSGRGIPVSITQGQQANSISAQEQENRNFLYNFSNLETNILLEITELEEEINKITKRHIYEIKEFQTQWNIKTEDWVY